MDPVIACGTAVRCLPCVKFATHLHIHEHAAAGFVDAEGRPLLIDMGDHLLGHLLGVFGKIPFASPFFFKLIVEIVGNDPAAGNGKMHAAKKGIHTGCYKIMSDGDGLFTHPFWGCACRRQIGNIIAKSAFLDDGGSCYQDAAVVDAGAQVQNRRNADGLANLGKTGTAVLLCSLGQQQAFRQRRVDLLLLYGSILRRESARAARKPSFCI